MLRMMNTYSVICQERRKCTERIKSDSGHGPCAAQIQLLMDSQRVLRQSVSETLLGLLDIENMKVLNLSCFVSRKCKLKIKPTQQRPTESHRFDSSTDLTLDPYN